MRLTLLMVVLFAGVTAFAGTAEAQQPQDPSQDPSEEEPADKAVDPVCKLMVRRDPDLSVEHEGRTYYFCMRKDLEAFEKDPEKYLREEEHSHPDPDVTG